jgi:hypothetical protein
MGRAPTTTNSKTAESRAAKAVVTTRSAIVPPTGVPQLDVNPAYLSASTVATLSAQWQQEHADRATLPTLVLGEICTASAIARLRSSCRKWRTECLPDRYRYETCDAQLPEQLVRLIALVTQTRAAIPANGSARRFSHGSYTLLHDEETRSDAKRTPALRAVLFLDDWDAAWGGELVFVKDGETLLRVTPRANTLIIVEQRKDVHWFVKYVNHNAQKRSFILVGL